MSLAGEHPRTSSPPGWPGSVRLPPRTGTAWPRRARRGLTARLHAEALDLALAGGADPGADPLLATRARQLTTLRSRRQLAAGLTHARRDADSQRSRLTAVVAPDPHEVRSATSELTALERRLRDGQPVQATGAAIVRRLLVDGASPLYDPVGAGSLAPLLRAATVALEPHQP